MLEELTPLLPPQHHIELPLEEDSTHVCENPAVTSDIRHGITNAVGVVDEKRLRSGSPQHVKLLLRMIEHACWYDTATSVTSFAGIDGVGTRLVRLENPSPQQESVDML